MLTKGVDQEVLLAERLEDNVALQEEVFEVLLRRDARSREGKQRRGGGRE